MRSEPPIRRQLQLAAARYRLGLLPSEEFPALAMAALEAGLESRSLCELACEPLPDRWEINTVLERALRDCAVTIPSTDDAVEELLREYLRAIAQDEIEPRQGMYRLVNDLYRPHISKQTVQKYVGDQRGLEHLIGAFYSYDDLYERPTEVSFEGLYGPAAVPAFDRHVRELAEEWLKLNGDNVRGHDHEH